VRIEEADPIELVGFRQIGDSGALINVECRPDEFVVGGGWASNDEDGDLIVTINRPFDEQTWQVNAENISSNDVVSFTAYAVCVDVDVDLP